MPLKAIVTVPSGRTDASLPLVIVLHGRGADMHDLADLAPLLDDGYRFVLPNAPKAWEAAPGMTFGYTWFDGLPPDKASLASARAQLLEFIDETVQRFPPADGKLVLCGFSQGGMMALDAGFRTKQRVAGIAMMSGAIFEDDLPPIRAGIPVLVVHGTADELLNVNMARRARRVLESHGAEPAYHEFPMGHQVTMESIAAVAEFIRACVGAVSC